MKKVFMTLGLLALLCAVFSVVSMPAMAQRGGSGGGGSNARHGGNFNLIFDYAPPLGKYTPVGTGSYGITTYVTTLSLNIRVSSCDLPDGTQLTVTAYARDYFTGAPWPAKVAGTMTLSSRKASLAVTSLWTTAAGRLPVLTSIVITAPDGTVVLQGHP